MPIPAAAQAGNGCGACMNWPLLYPSFLSPGRTSDEFLVDGHRVEWLAGSEPFAIEGDRAESQANPTPVGALTEQLEDRTLLSLLDITSGLSPMTDRTRCRQRAT